MEIGNKIQKLRKKKNLSQSELSEIIGVARQTISKWELGETSPDLEQAKKLSKTFNVSLDELANNEVRDILTTKVSNTEKLVKITIIFMEVLVTLIILAIIGIIALFTYFNVQVVESKISIKCIRNNLEFIYDIEVNDKATKDIYEMEIANFVTTDQQLNKIIDIKKYKTAEELLTYIREYNLSNDGICE